MIRLTGLITLKLYAQYQDHVFTNGALQEKVQSVKVWTVNCLRREEGTGNSRLATYKVHCRALSDHVMH